MMLSTRLGVKDFIKLRARARALRFLEPSFYKGYKGVSVPDTPNVVVPNTPNIGCISVPNTPCPSTA